MNLSTKVFSLSANVYSSRFARQMAGRLWWVAILPILVFWFLGEIYDSAWYYLIPVSLFLVYPLLIFWGYFLCVMNKEAVLSARPHRLEFMAEGIFYREYRLKGNAYKKPSKVYIYPEDAIEENPDGINYLIPLSDILSKEIDGGFFIVSIKGTGTTELIIPLQSLSAENTEKLIKS